jgi:hypothetical protein
MPLSPRVRALSHQIPLHRQVSGANAPFMVGNREIGVDRGYHSYHEYFTRFLLCYPCGFGRENKQRAEPETVLQVLGIKPSILSVCSVGHLSQLITYGYSLPEEAFIVCSSARDIVAQLRLVCVCVFLCVRERES